MGVGRRRVALAVRSLLLAALVLALAGFQLVLPVDRVATVFVVDLSDSVGNVGKDDALAFIEASIATKRQGDVAGVVAFGKNALVERMPTDRLEESTGRIGSTPVKTATDIGAALRLASALFPDDAQKRIVLLSDGNDTTGGGQTEAALAAERGIRIETRRIGPGSIDEVLVERLTSPSIARLGESVQVIAEIRSSVAQTATVRLFADGTLVKTQPVELTAGLTRVTFDLTPKEAGFHTFRAVVEAGRDTFSQNDRADSNTIVKGEPRTLVLVGDDDVAAELVGALREQRQQVDTMIPEALPTDFASLATYDSVVLVDVPRLRLNDRQLAALQVYVRDLGKGLVMVGGPRSYGAGGYQKTVLEETLPVDMGVRDREKQPDIALVVVIDQSGSMAACHCNTFGNGAGGGTGIGGVQKVDIGKEAILRAAAAMTERDELGVVAFNESAHWVVRTQPLGNVNDLQGQIAAIKADGQTNIYAGLDEAVKSLDGVTATRRHIILLTDGWSTSGQYDEILAKMKAAGITLSTVGAGGGVEPVPREPRDQGRRPLLLGQQPGEHPRHLPQGDPAGLRPADRRGAVLPDPDVVLADPARPRRRAAEAARLQRHDRQARGPDGARDEPRRSAPRPVAVRAGPVRGLDLGLHRSLGQELAGLAGLRPVLQPARELDVPGRGDRRHRSHLRRRRRQDDPARRERRVGRVGPRLLLDQRGRRRARASSRSTWTSSRWRRASTRRRSARSIRAPTPSASPRSSPGPRRSVAPSGWSRRPPPSTGCWARTNPSSRPCGTRPAAPRSWRPRIPGSAT